MQVGFHFDNLVRYLQVRPSRSDLSAAAAATPVVSAQESAQLGLNQRRVSQLTKALNELDDELSRVRVRTSSGKAAVTSQSLGLNTTQSATTLNTTEQVNTATTSYSPFGPVFTGPGGSDALPEITGVYNGENGDDSLRFLVTRTGVHGTSRIDIKVYDGSGDKIKTIKVQPWHSLTKKYNIGNGLQFQLGTGTLVQGDDFYLDVYENTPSVVDPDNPFDGTHDDRPNFDLGESVDAGSFDINGVTINVNADDTINSVLDRISASAADVDAVFDSNSETVRLTRRTPGSAYDITLSNDDSGFLAAVKLDGVSSTPGLDRDADKPLDQAAIFSGVGSGGLLINGYNFDIDVTTDSLSDVVSMINDAGIDITASLVQGGQRISLKADIEGMALSIDDQGTQFFDALGVAEKTYNAIGSSGVSRSRSYRIADSVDATIDLINDVFHPAENAFRSESLDQLRSDILSSLRASTPDGDSRVGLLFDFESPVGNRFSRIDRQELTSSIRHDLGSSQVFLGGLMAGLRGALASYGAAYGDAAIASGTMLNSRA